MSNTFELAPRQTAISFFSKQEENIFLFFHNPFFYKNTPAQANHLSPHILQIISFLQINSLFP